jgi:hypothetical protein
MADVDENDEREREVDTGDLVDQLRAVANNKDVSRSVECPVGGPSLKRAR